MFSFLVNFSESEIIFSEKCLKVITIIYLNLLKAIHVVLSYSGSRGRSVKKRKVEGIKGKVTFKSPTAKSCLLY